MSFQGYAKQSRDSNRLTTIKTIEKWVDLFLTKSWKIPAPDEATAFTGGSTNNPVKISQWTVWAQMVWVINMNQIPLDPKTQAKYHYSVFGETPYYQIGIEQEQDSLWYFAPAFAESEEVMISWNYRLDPSLPSLFVVKDSVWSGGIFDPSVCFVVEWSENTFSSASGACEKKSQMTLSSLDKSLVWYWDMETIYMSGSNKYMKDLSGHGNDGIFTWTILPSSTWWIMGKWINFSGSWYIEVLNSPSLNPTKEISLVATIIYKNSAFTSGNIWIIEKTYSWFTEPYYQYKLWLTPNNNSSVLQWALWSSYSIKWQRIGVGYNNLNSFYDWQAINLVSTYDGRITKIYINWDKKAERIVENDLGIDIYTSNLCFWKAFCWFNSTSYYYLHGIIDDAKIYNRALSDQEIAQQARIAGF